MKKYIGDVYIEAEKHKINRDGIRFVMPEVFSPYVEVNAGPMNRIVISEEVEINPYERFSEIFETVNTNMAGFIKSAVFNVVMHILAELDSKEGMSASEFYVRAISREIESGNFGADVMKTFCRLKKNEQRAVGFYLFKLIKTGEEIECFRLTLKELYPQSLMYIGKSKRKNMVLYLGVKEEYGETKKIELLGKLFLAYGYDIKIFWNYHFGVVGINETMKAGSVAVY